MIRTATLLVALAGAGLAASGASLAQAAEGSRDAGARAERILLAQSGGFDALRARTRGTQNSSSRRERTRGDDNASETAVEAASESSAVVDTETDAAVTEPNASDRAREVANENSAVGGPEEAIPPDLSGLEIGLTVRGADGVEVGTIERVNRDSDGTVRNVIVARANGQGNMTLAPGSLSISGDVVTTTTTVPQQ